MIRNDRVAPQEILDADERLACGYELLQRFRRLVARRGVRDLDCWLEDAAASEAFGRSPDLIIPDSQRARHRDGYRQVMHTGVSRCITDVLAVPALCADGRRVSLEFHVVLLRNTEDDVTGIAAIIRDVTARWQQDRALRQRFQALEAERP